MNRRFKVIQYANKLRSDMDGYAQAFEVMEDDQFCGGWYGAGYDAGYGVVVPIKIKEKRVNADSPMQALYKFKRWLSFGLSDAYLLGEVLTKEEVEDAIRNQYGCFRLGARIWDLRRAGFSIGAEMIETVNGKRIARYRMGQ